jgi:membrane glycosyltransferase
MLLRRSDRVGIGGAFRGFGSVICETIVSALIAPVMMLMQSRAVTEILMGRDSGWATQQRDGSRASIATLALQYRLPTIVGILLALAAYSVSLPLLLWMLPVILGLSLAVPVVAFTSAGALGRRLRSLGVFLTPEERAPPPTLVRANALLADQHEPEGHPITLLAESPPLLAAHLSMLPPPKARSARELDVPLVLACAKLEASRDFDEAIELLERRELVAVLGNAAALNMVLSKRTAQSSQSSPSD